ncbi:hypothetical protein TWF718_000393 [Orbilia javanica]|uniref:Uncharacterized protein n=1 Tax=Orbilia javanica TaxID=47235 RepID=A0AAN8P134_9PEZI
MSTESWPDAFESTRSYPSLRATVPRPKLKRKANMTATVIKGAFSDEYWSQKAGNWSDIFPIQNVLTLIQKVCDKVFDQHQDDMVRQFPYRKQGKIVKNAMYTEFFILLDLEGALIGDDYKTLILEMLEATDFSNVDYHQNNVGSTAQPVTSERWLFEYCMRRTWDNRISRAKTKDPRTKKRIRGMARFIPET